MPRRISSHVLPHVHTCSKGTRAGCETSFPGVNLQEQVINALSCVNLQHLARERERARERARARERERERESARERERVSERARVRERVRARERVRECEREREREREREARLESWKGLTVRTGSYAAWPFRLARARPNGRAA